MCVTLYTLNRKWDPKKTLQLPLLRNEINSGHFSTVKQLHLLDSLSTLPALKSKVCLKNKPKRFRVTLCAEELQPSEDPAYVVCKDSLTNGRTRNAFWDMLGHEGFIWCRLHIQEVMLRLSAASLKWDAECGVIGRRTQPLNGTQRFHLHSPVRTHGT